MTHRARFALLAFLATTLAGLVPAPCAARPPGGEMGPFGRPLFLDQLFPPRLVMQNQEEIGLTATQREAITKAMAEAQTRLVEMQWRFEEQSAALEKLLAHPTVNAEEALAQAARVMAVEQEMKKSHLSMLIQIKNQLEPRQQTRLGELRGRRERWGHGPEPTPDER